MEKTIVLETEEQVTRFIEILRKAQAYNDEYYNSQESKKDEALIDIMLCQVDRDKPKRLRKYGI